MTTPDASAPPTTDPVAQLLGADRPPRGWRRPFWWALALLLLLLAAGLYYWSGRQAQQAQRVEGVHGGRVECDAVLLRHYRERHVFTLE